MTTARRDWNLGMVGAREAWEHLPKHADGAIDWGDIRVGHLDTGYTRHPIFGDWDASESWLRPDLGRDIVAGRDDPTDPLDYEGNPGHGTRTCSVICGNARRIDPDDESELGVAPGLPVVPFRCVTSVVLIRERHREAVAEAIDRAVAAGCQVISISLGVPFFSPSQTGGLGKAVDRAYKKGVIIAAAGGQVIDRVTYPGKFNRTIGCGGLTWQRRIWWDYANGRDMIDVWAPAENVLVASRFAADGSTAAMPVEGDDPGSFAVPEIDGDDGSSSSSGSLSALSGSSGKLTKSTGTSFATAHVAAAAAMWLRLKGPALDAAYDEPWQRVEAFRKLLKHKTMRRVNGPSLPNGSRTLTIHRLLEAKLPKASSLTKAAKDAKKSL